MYLRIQDYLRYKGTLKDLEEGLSLKVTKKDNLVILNYNMIDTPKEDPIAKECRGLILDESQGWAIASIAFPRFFNAGEGQADQLDWANSWAEEKIDGSLVTLFYWEGKWRISTRGMIDADGPLGQVPEGFKYQTFADAIWPLIPEELKEGWECSKEFIWVFEFVSPWNRNVTPYDEPALYLLTLRDRERGEVEHPIDDVDWHAERFGFKRPKRFHVECFDKVEEALQDLRAVDEGFVLVDKDHHRVKVKSRTYLQLHRMVSNQKPNLWEIIVAGDAGEFRSYFPEYNDLLKKKEDFLLKMLQDLYNAWYCYNDIESQKKFALKVKDLPGSFLLFNLRRRDDLTSVAEAWGDLEPQQKVRFLEKFQEKT